MKSTEGFKKIDCRVSVELDNDPSILYLCPQDKGKGYLEIDSPDEPRDALERTPITSSLVALREGIRARGRTKHPPWH